MLHLLLSLIAPSSPLPVRTCPPGPELANALVGWDVGMWTDDLYRAEQEASKARRERLASAMKRVRNLSMMGNIGVAILGACAVLLPPLHPIPPYCSVLF
jgi:hypothetical protein